MLLHKSFLLAGVLSLATCVFATPLSENYPHLFPRQNGAERYIVQGVNDGVIGVRLELRELQANQPQWNLYLLGLQRMQAADQRDPFSWYQIMGIHGVPYTQWGNVPQAPGGENRGYCMHNAHLFPTWHRPYLALYEQTLYWYMQQCVNDFRDPRLQKMYADALVGFRVPYIEIARDLGPNENVLPDSLLLPRVRVQWYDGTDREMDNPLEHYKFQYSNELLQQPYTSWKRTMRRPNDPENLVNPVSLQHEYVAELNRNVASYRQRIVSLMYNYKDWFRFSNAGWYPNGPANRGSYDSIESIHDGIHASLGGRGGHMGATVLSAHDPFFMILHCTADRLIAFWQAINPDQFVEPNRLQKPSFTYAGGSILDANSGLTPFRSSFQAFWTSNTCRQTEALKYTYRGLDNPEAKIDEQYDPRYLQQHRRRRVKRSDPAEANSPSPYSEKDGKTTISEYVLNIRSNKNAFDGSSYQIYVFLGECKEPPSTWYKCDNVVGIHSIFAALGIKADCEACEELASATDYITSGTVHLTDALLGKYECGELKCFDPECVDKYLKEQLKWKVTLGDGCEVSAAEVKDFMASVVTSTVSLPDATHKKPEWSDEINLLKKSTEDKPGGLKSECEE